MLAAGVMAGYASVPVPHFHLQQDFFKENKQVGLPSGPVEASSSLLKAVPRPQLHTSSPLLAAPAAEGESTVYGYLINSNSTTSKYGYYRINAGAAPTFMWQDELTALQWSMYTGWLRDGKLCGHIGVKLDNAFMAYAYTEMDPANGTVTRLDDIDLTSDKGMNSVFISCDYRPISDMVYGYSYNSTGESFTFCRSDARDFSTVEVVADVPFGEVCSSMCYNEQKDCFYGITTTGKFVEIDTEGRSFELFDINLPGYSKGAITGMTYVPSMNKYVWNVYFTDKTSGFYTIDPETHAVEKLALSNGAHIFSYLICPEENAPADAPGAATLVGAALDGGVLEGSLTFRMPGKHQDGSPLEGDINWALYINGAMVENGVAKAGQEVTAAVSKLRNTQTTFGVIVEQGGKKSVPMIYRRWIGSDTPSAPANVKLSEGRVSWGPVATSVHDGYVDYATMHYEVEINGQLYGEPTDTCLAITLPQGQPFASYTAYVKAVYDGKKSEAGRSNYITCGEPLALPLHYRPEEPELELFTCINVDGRKNDKGEDLTWHYGEDMGFPSFISGHTGEDWLILPPMRFENTDSAYRYEMEIGITHDSDPSGTFEVWIGEAPTAEGMTRQLVPPTHVKYMRGIILEEYFALDHPGTYYIGVLVKTGKVSFHVSDFDIRLSNRPASLPMGISALNAVAGADGALTAEVSFKMPTHQVSGGLLDPTKPLTARVNVDTYIPGKAESDHVSTTTVEALPGDTVNIVVPTAQNYNRISVDCALEGRYGKVESMLLYTGLVRPYTVNDLAAKVLEDNLSVRLTWTPPTEGEDEGNIGNSFRYLIYYYGPQGWTYGDDAGVDNLEYTYRLNADAGQGTAILGVMAYNAAGLSYHVKGVSVCIGTPYELPMQETFPNCVESYMPLMTIRPTDLHQGTYWTMDEPALISPLFEDASARYALIGFTDLAEASNLKTMVGLPKFSTVGTTGLSATFHYWAGRYGAKCRVYGADFATQDAPVVIQELPQDRQYGWRSEAVQLPANYEGQQWIQLLFEGDITDNTTFAMLAGYTISGTLGADAPIAAEGTITASNGMLHVVGFQGSPLTVADLAGRTVITVPSLDIANGFALPAGIYIVKAATTTAKVVVK